MSAFKWLHRGCCKANTATGAKTWTGPDGLCAPLQYTSPAISLAGQCAAAANGEMAQAKTEMVNNRLCIHPGCDN